MSVYNFVHCTSKIYSVPFHLIKICGSHGGETKIKTSRAVMPLTLKNNVWKMDLKAWNKSVLCVEIIPLLTLLLARIFSISANLLNSPTLFYHPPPFGLH